MKNKGFTLVELLAVIVILVVIFILVFPAVEHVLSSGKQTVSNAQINTILDAAYDLTLKDLELLPEKGKTTYITLAQLKSLGLVEADIRNPETKELYPDDLVISVENVGAGYKYSNTNSKLNGDYLYTVNLNVTNSLSEGKLPKIELDTALQKNSDGDFVDEVDINTDFEEISYTAESSKGTDLTSDVFVSISYKNKYVTEIDTSKLGIYKINYTVVDDLGYSVTVTVNVIITDNEPPVLTLPENNTISTTVTELDLLGGVTCTDNSGSCDISTSGTIEFGEVGKYPISYTAQDSSGNTKTQERIITIE